MAKKWLSPFAVGERENNNVPETNFDTCYKSIQIVDVVVRTGDGEEDYVIQKKVVEDFKPIKEVVDADAQSVGVYNIIKNVLRTGDTSLLPIDDGKCNVDLVGAPETLMELDQLGKEAAKKFGELPADLVGDLDMAKFVENMSQEKFDQFVAALAARQEKKGENGNE